MEAQRRGEKLLFELTVTHLLRNLGYEAQLKDYVKREHPFTAGGNVNWFSHYGEQYGIFNSSPN